MNQWAFVAAAYGLTLAGTLALVGLSFAAMRRSERRAEGADR